VVGSNDHLTAIRRRERAPSTTSSPELTNGSALEPGAFPEAIHIDLLLHDSEIVDAIREHPEGRSRQNYIQTAIKIGVLAIKQAKGRIDSDRVRNEGERLIAELETKFGGYQKQISSVLSDTLKHYFDPTDGRFTDRVDRLVKDGGDLERLMRAQMDAAAVKLKQSLEDQVGPGSRFAQLLAPGESNALVFAIRNNVDDLVSAQRDKILAEFSLDKQDSALSRLRSELTAHHGRFTNDLKESIATVVGEFSLDKDDSALSRLVKRVEEAQRKISEEFTLDEERSALSRMRRELSDVIEKMRKDNREFQEKVISELASMQARRKESFASTRHGKDFERAVYEFIADACQKAGDIPEDVGDRVGEMKALQDW
jgi:hypothetical protein